MKGQNDAESMQKIFGQLFNKGCNTSKKPSSSGLTGPTDTSDSGKNVTLTGQSGSSSRATQKSPIPSPSVQSQFDVTYYYPCIACLDGGLAWVRTEGKTLQLVDREGSVKDSINIDFSFNDITLTPDGDILMSHFSNNCIKCLSRQKTISTVFSTSWKPSGLCCLHNGDIAVSFRDDAKAVVYSRDGQIRLTLDNIKFRSPQRVAVNKVNQDIYICDHERRTYDSPGKLIVAGADGKLRYEYTGQGDSMFTPVEVCTDQMGHILITDYSNHRVHMLDQEGRFIRYVLTSQQGLCKPVTIDVDREGYVWVGEYVNIDKGHVKVACTSGLKCL